MNRCARKRLGISAAVLAGMTLLVGACDAGSHGAPNPLAPSVGPEVGAAGSDPTASPPVTSRLVDMLNLSIQDEYRSHQTYQSVLADFGSRTPFSNITDAEARHIEAASQLFANRGLDVPPSTSNPENVPRFASFKAACAAAVASETATWSMYSGFLTELQATGSVPQDVQNVFTNLMEASRDKHLPAFANCAT